MKKNKFFNLFEKQDFTQALDALNKLNQDEQESILKQLYYQSREAKMPIVVSILCRKLHDGKTFDDFYNAWMPPQDAMSPFKVGEKIYYNFFDVPVRVINAVDMADPKEVISIGLVWCDNEEQFKEVLKKATKDENNAIRSDSVATVADKISVKIYKVNSRYQSGKLNCYMLCIPDQKDTNKLII